jgi:thiamine-phosphate pyrophosphorylase
VSRLSRSESAPLLCYVTDRRSLVAARPNGTFKILQQRIAAAAAAGVDWIQIREKDLSGKECSALVREAVRIAASSWPGASASSPLSSRNKAAREHVSTRIFANDRLDVALVAQAGGAHLGGKSLPVEQARRLVKSLRGEEDFLIGVSCHSLETARAAERGGADYLFFGPVFTTPSKAAYGAPQGLKRLVEVCRAIAIPVLAIGGITLENAADCLSAGASGIAAIHLFQDAPDLVAVVDALQKLSG